MARILIVAYTNYYQDSRVKRNAEALAERGDHVDVICLDHGPRGLSGGVNIIGLPLRRYRGGSNSYYIGSYLRFFAMASMHATKLSRRKPYQVVIVCTMPDAAVLCALGPKFYGARVVLDVHDTMPELYQDKFKGVRGALGSRLLMAEERASAWFAERVMAVHEPHRERLVRAGVPAAKLSVVMNLPDPRVFQPVPGSEGLRSSKSIDAGLYSASAAGHVSKPNGAANHREGFKLVCHGTVTVRLGLDLAVRAVARLRERIPSVHLHIIGEGDFLGAVRELTEKLELQPNVTFTPSLAVEQLPRALAPAAVGIVPNRASQATHLMLPAKLLEYAALGIPVIASRLDTMQYYFPAGSVRYFEPGDVEGLASAIEDLYYHPEIRQRLSRNAAQVTAKLSWERQRSQLFDTVDSLLTGNGISAQRDDEFRPMPKIGRASQAGE